MLKYINDYRERAAEFMIADLGEDFIREHSDYISSCWSETKDEIEYTFLFNKPSVNTKISHAIITDDTKTCDDVFIVRLSKDNKEILSIENSVNITDL